MECVKGDRLMWRGRKQAVPSLVMREYYREHVGSVRKDQHVHHTCGNPWCVEVTHLEAVTFDEHIERHRYHRLYAGFDETAKSSTFV